MTIARHLIRHIKITVFCTGDISIDVQLIPLAIIQLYHIPGMIIVVNDVHLQAHHVCKQTECCCITDTYRIFAGQHIVWCKCLRVLSRHGNDMPATLTDVFYHPVIDCQFLLISAHRILYDLIQNFLCHIIGLFVLCAQSRRIILQIGIRYIFRTADLILIHNLKAILLICALLLCILRLSGTLIIDELTHFCILDILRIHLLHEYHVHANRCADTTDQQHCHYACQDISGYFFALPG